MAAAREVGRRFIDAFNAHDQQRIRDLNGDNTVFEAPTVSFVISHRTSMSTHPRSGIPGLDLVSRTATL